MSEKIRERMKELPFGPTSNPNEIVKIGMTPKSWRTVIEALKTAEEFAESEGKLELARRIRINRKDIETLLAGKV